MIIEAIVGAMLGVVRFLAGGLPEASSLGFGPVAPVFEAMMVLNSALPVVEVLTAFGLCLTVLGGVFLFRLFMTIRSTAPFL